MHRCRFAPLALCLLFATLGAVPAEAQQATFFSMGPVAGKPRESVPYDVREDGRVVVGFEYRDGPIRWKRPDEFEALGVRGRGMVGRAFGISADGRTIVGTWLYSPFRWTPHGGIETLGDWKGAASDVSADGSVIVGSRSAAGPDHAFRWTAEEGFLELGTVGGVDGISKANAISDDGRAIVGRSMTPSGVQHAYRWTANEGFRDLGSSIDRPSVANGVSYDGLVVVGHMSAPRQAFVWTAKNGMQTLATIQRRASSAMDVSDDGNVIVGQARSPFGDAACIWTDGEPRYLSDLLQNEYGIDLTGWFILREITACSGDGTKLVGSGHFDSWRIGFVATIPPPPTMTTSVEPAGIYRAVVGERFDYPFFAQDPGGEPLTFGAAGMPSNASATPTPGPTGDSFNGLFEWTPTAADLGTTHEVHLFVRDAEQRRASLRFKVRAVADDSAVAIDDEPASRVSDHSAERSFAAPIRVATSTAQEVAYDLYANSGARPLAAEAYQAADAAQAFGEAADSLVLDEAAHLFAADELAGYRELRANQSEAALVAADRLYRLYQIEADDTALVASAYAYRASLYAAIDLAE